MSAWEWVGTVAVVVLIGPLFLYFFVAIWVSTWLMLRELWDSLHE